MSEHPDIQEGVEKLTPEEQLTQLLEFFEDNYPEIWVTLSPHQWVELQSLPESSEKESRKRELQRTAERQWGRVPDLLTHSAQLALGASLDHSMPGVALTQGVQSVDIPGDVPLQVYIPSNLTGALGVSLHGGPGWHGHNEVLEQLWRPLFAAIAEQSGTVIADLDYPLEAEGSWKATQQAVAHTLDGLPDTLAFSPEVQDALTPEQMDHAANPGIIVFGSGFVAAQQWLQDHTPPWLVAFSPRIYEDTPVWSTQKTPTLISLASRDSLATPAQDVEKYFGQGPEYTEYLAEHIIATPEVWRQRIADTARWVAENG